jgi:hypothetical protein
VVSVVKRSPFCSELRSSNFLKERHYLLNESYSTGRPTAVPPTCGRPCWTRQSLVIRCLLVPCARILSRGKSLLGLRAGRAGREPTFMRRDRILYRSFKKFAASRPKAMKNPPPPVIASAAKQFPGRYGDCFAACGGSQCNRRKFSTATRMAVEGGYFRSRNFLKERYTTRSISSAILPLPSWYNLSQIPKWRL